MKKALLLLFFALVGYKAEAQNEKYNNYVFATYEDAVVKFKTGPNINIKLNYNTVTEEMVYLQGGTTLAIAETSTIDTVYIKDLKFIPIDNIFYQVVNLKDRQLYVRLTTKATPPPVDTGLGTSQTTAQSSTAIKVESRIYSFDPPGYKFVPKNMLYLKKGNQFVLLSNEKALDAFYPGKSKEIKRFVADNKINFEKADDVAKLLNTFSK
jgi:hypothetical protein